MIGAPAVREGSDSLEREVQGWVVITHSCDIADRGEGPGYIQVAPLVAMSDDASLRIVEKRRTPRLAYVPGVAHLRLVGDLTRVQTVDRDLMDGWERVPGCRSDEERRDLAEALRRKFGRLAAPDEFTPFVARLRDRLKGKCGKDTQDKGGKSTGEGRCIELLDEIRVRAAPEWEAPRVDIQFWFIRPKETPDVSEEEWDASEATWRSLLPANERFRVTELRVLTKAELDAEEWDESDRLDLAHISPVGG